MCKSIKLFLMFGAAMVFSAAFAVQVNAQAASGCVTGSWANIAGNGTDAKLNVTNKANCGAKQVSLCSYRMYIKSPNPGWLSTQTLYDSQVITLQPGQTMTMTVKTDKCLNQVDAYEGPCVNPFPSDNTSVPYIFIGRFTEYTETVCAKCTDECNIKDQMCDGNGYKTCVMGGNGCTKWQHSDCASGQICSNGTCIDDCTNECDVKDQRVCNGNGFKQCGNYDSDKCLEWGNFTNCSNDQKCVNGSCVDIDICSDTLSGSPSSYQQNLCANAGGQIFCGNGWCKCNCQVTPTVDLNSSGSASCNRSATLSWTSNNATSCYASGSWSGSKATSGSENVGNFTGSRTYTITCNRGGKSATDSVTLSGSDDPLDVNAGSDRYLNEEDDRVQLDGSVDGDYDSLNWSCTGGSLSDSDILRPNWRPSFSYNNDNYYYDYNRTFTCTLTARNVCGSDSDTVKITVERRQKDFNVSLIARPKSDCAPLDNVDMIATVTNYGSSSGDFTYYFDCENDGSWDKIVSDDSADYTAVDLCDYRNAGSYTARVKVTRNGREATDTEIVRAETCNIPPQSGRVSITKTVSNLTQNIGYQGTVSANPLDIVSYKIVVTGVSGTTDNVWVGDMVPNGITNVREIMLDGQPAGGSLGSLELGTIRAGQTKTITYTATVANASSFVWGQTTLNNVATLHAGNDIADSRAAVSVYRRAVQGATTVSTGLGSDMIAGLGIALAGAVFCLVWLLVFAKPRRKIC